MKTLKNGLDRFLAFVCIVDFIVMVLLTVYQVVVRYVFKSPSSVSEVLTRYCFVWLILLSATYVFGQRDHICITYLKDKMNGSAKRMTTTSIAAFNILFALPFILLSIDPGLWWFCYHNHEYAAV